MRAYDFHDILENELIMGTVSVRHLSSIDVRQGTHSVGLLVDMQAIREVHSQLRLLLPACLPQADIHVDDWHFLFLRNLSHCLGVLARIVKAPIALLRRITSGKLCAALVAIEWRRSEKDNSGIRRVIL